jgi:hypothetical protein
LAGRNVVAGSKNLDVTEPFNPCSVHFLGLKQSKLGLLAESKFNFGGAAQRYVEVSCVVLVLKFSIPISVYCYCGLVFR